MVKPETFDHVHLVYHFTVPLNVVSLIKKIEKSRKTGDYL